MKKSQSMHLVIDKSLPRHAFGFSVSTPAPPISKYGHFYLQNTKMATAVTPNSRLQLAFHKRMGDVSVGLYLSVLLIMTLQSQ